MILGCSEPEDPNRLEHIVLRDGDASATLVLPAAYRVQPPSPTSGIRIDFEYPSMLPAEKPAELSKMSVFVALSELKQSRRYGSLAEMMFEEATSDHFDPTKPGLAYRAGRKGAYQIFHRGDPAGSGVFSTYYIFKAADGQWVRVRDGGQDSAIYLANRQITKNLSIQYEFVKSIGTDFIQIDEVVTGFVKAHLKQLT